MWAVELPWNRHPGEGRMNQRTSQDVDAPTLCMQMGDDDMEEDGCNGRSLELQDGPKSPLQRELKKKTTNALLICFNSVLYILNKKGMDMWKYITIYICTYTLYFLCSQFQIPCHFYTV